MQTVPGTGEMPKHEGVKQLAEDGVLMSAVGIKPFEVEALRHLLVLGPRGWVEIENKAQALRWLDALRASHAFDEASDA